jgi:hypothetical protein
MECTKGAQRVVLDGYASKMAQEMERRAGDWFDSSDRAQGVGSRHHTVPMFFLKRFACGKTILVRDRATGATSTRSISDLAIKNFYTVVGHDGELDGRLEQALCWVEGNAASLLTRLLSPFRVPKPLSWEDSLNLAQFLAFQIVRGTRRRRERELLADYSVKLRVDGVPGYEAAQRAVIVPHPNEHLRTICTLSERLTEYIASRPLTHVIIDQPLFITCDEPVLNSFVEEHFKHLPSCDVTQKQRKRRARKARQRKEHSRETIHIYPTRPSGVAVAEEVAIAASPSSLLLLGGINQSAPPEVLLRGSEAAELADEVNRLLIEQAYDWVAAHPDHPTFRSFVFPAPGPILKVCDGGTAIAKSLAKAPEPRRPQRLRRDW